MMEMTYQLFLEQVIAQRADGTVPDDQIVDTHFVELMSDPVAMLHRVYEQLGYEWPKGHDRAITAYLAAKPKAKHGAHTYSLRRPRTRRRARARDVRRLRRALRHHRGRGVRPRRRSDGARCCQLVVRLV